MRIFLTQQLLTIKKDGEDTIAKKILEERLYDDNIISNSSVAESTQPKKEDGCNIIKKIIKNKSYKINLIFDNSLTLCFQESDTSEGTDFFIGDQKVCSKKKYKFQKGESLKKESEYSIFEKPVTRADYENFVSFIKNIDKQDKLKKWLSDSMILKIGDWERKIAKERKRMQAANKILVEAVKEKIKFFDLTVLGRENIKILSKIQPFSVGSNAGGGAGVNVKVTGFTHSYDQVTEEHEVRRFKIGTFKTMGGSFPEDTNIESAEWITLKKLGLVKTS